jgi:hypothetical protein
MISKKTKKVSPPIDEWLKEAKADPATRYVPAVETSHKVRPRGCAAFAQIWYNQS